MSDNLAIVSASNVCAVNKFNKPSDVASRYKEINDCFDFQMFSDQKSIAEVKKGVRVRIMEMWPIPENPGLKKKCVMDTSMRHALSVATQKSGKEKVAVGMANGVVRIVTIHPRKFEKIIVDSEPKPVHCLDFNINDSLLASVLRNGLIDLFNFELRKRADVINIDKSSFIARFHPMREFQLGVASSKGTVSVYDVHAKNTIFEYKNAHHLGCHDLSISKALADTFTSVGEDGYVKAFDMRVKSPVWIYNNRDPLTAVAKSSCDKYLCVGDEKGHLITFDMRQPERYLSKTKVHDMTVKRLAIVHL